MGLKVLGVLCAGVFVGAALMEVKQLGWGKRRDRSDDQSGDSGDDQSVEPDDDERED